MPSLLINAIALGLLLLKAYAAVDCLRRPAAAFVAYGKLNKPAWLAITLVAVAFHLLLYPDIISIFSIAGTVAAIVYIVDVKPAVSGAGS